MSSQGKNEVLGEKPEPVTLLFTANSTWTLLEQNVGHSDDRPVSSHLNHDKGAK